MASNKQIATLQKKNVVLQIQSPKNNGNVQNVKNVRMLKILLQTFPTTL